MANGRPGIDRSTDGPSRVTGSPWKNLATFIPFFGGCWSDFLRNLSGSTMIYDHYDDPCLFEVSL